MGTAGEKLPSKADKSHLQVAVTAATLCSMKATFLGLLMVLTSVTGLQAQLTATPAQTQPLKVQLTTEHTQFIAQEPMEITIRVLNYTGEALQLNGSDPEWITFSVEALGNKSLVRQAAPLDVDRSIPPVGTGMMATVRVGLVPQFEISKAGRYKIVARVKAGRWGEITSEPYFIDIVPGITMWEQEFGVPNAEGKEPEMRKYKLIQSRNMDAPVIYVKVTDIYESRVFGLSALGKMVTQPTPEQITDRANRLHVLHQSGAKSFTYSMINYDGTVLLRMRYEYTDTRPRLRANENGDIIISGGIRVKSEYDIDPLADATAQTLTTP